MNDSIHGGLRVRQSTPLVQLQDRGRFGCRHLGVTQGGALDWLSMAGPTGCWAIPWTPR